MHTTTATRSRPARPKLDDQAFDGFAAHGDGLRFKAGLCSRATHILSVVCGQRPAPDVSVAVVSSEKVTPQTAWRDGCRAVAPRENQENSGFRIAAPDEGGLMGHRAKDRGRFKRWLYSSSPLLHR